MRLKAVFLAVVLALGLPAMPAGAQGNTQTLADIRQQLTVLYVEIQRLKGELNTTGGAEGSTGAGSLLDRVNALEAELTHLTAKTEEMRHHIDQVVKDGTNQVGDLEFRLCELESDCDISSLGDTPTLGGGALPDVAAAAPAGAQADTGTDTAAGTGSGELAVAEQADYDAAMSAFKAGDAVQAADLFSRFADTYPGGSLAGDALYMKGEALAEQGLVADSARAYLASFSGSPTGPHAADALLKLGVSLGQLGQVNEACVTLGEVAKRFPAADAVAEAAQARASLGCN